MFLTRLSITKDSFVTDIVKEDYRTANVFRKYDIDFCCGGRWPLGMVCETKDLDFTAIKSELQDSLRTIQLSNSLQFDKWNVNFLMDYIVNVHHQYLLEYLPQVKDQLTHFVKDHADQYPFLKEVEKQFDILYKETFPHLKQEEDILFPYIKQIAHAYRNKESYASLLVRTLRKPVEMMHHEHESVSRILKKMRELTNNYTAPVNACVSHRVTFSMLKELDNDLAQHVYLENNILFPKAIAMEKELLETK